MKRLRVLLSAYYCSPYQGGESAVGWKFACRLARDHQVTVLCGDLHPNGNTGPDLARYAGEEGLPDGLEVCHVPATGLARALHDLHAWPGLWFLYYPAYRRWQRQAFRKALDLHRRNPFDVAHQLNVIGYREPGYLDRLGIPLVWGPISGAPMIPWSFLRGFSFKEKYRWGTRNLANWLQMRYALRPRSFARAACRIWTVTTEDQRMVEDLWGARAETMIETGTELRPESRLRTHVEGRPLRLCWSGLFQGRKALHLLLEALVGLPRDCWRLDILGEGPEKEHWMAIANEAELGTRIRWHGHLSRDSALKVVAECDLLVHTSVKEGTPHVVLEALGLGMPVLCHDACGMGVAVDSTCGLKVPLLDPATSVRGFREALARVLDEPALLEELSRGALKQAERLGWESKIRYVSETLAAVVENAKEP